MTTAAVSNGFRIFASQGLVVKEFVFSAGDKSWLSFHTGDKMVAIPWYWKSGERPESSSCGVRWYFGWTFETNYSFWVAERLEQIRPVASVGAFIVYQPWGTRLLLRYTISALDITGAAFIGIRVDTELELAARR